MTPRAAVSILRPHLAAAAGLCALSGTLISGGSPSPAHGALAFAAVFGIAAGTMPLNDLVDRHADAVNRPERPIPSGAISPREAVLLFAAVSLAGVAAAAALGIAALILTITLFAVGTLYNLTGKRWGLLGNIMVSTSVACSFLLGDLATPTAEAAFGVRVIALAVATFVGSLALETAGDIHDETGDRENKGRSFIIRHGRAAALFLYTALVLVFVAVCVAAPLALKPIPHSALWVSIPCSVAFAGLAAAFLGTAAGSAEDHNESEWSPRSKRLTTIIMLQAGVAMLGVLILTIGSL
ncbi:MAG: UbiA family prenyltransferase [Spirochaetota bacterium]